jgi:biotin transport system substrate-specific component
MAIAVFGFALLTGLTALWEIPLPFTPVPITGQTFAILLAGATLGLRAGAASQLLYLAMGIVGVPFFAGGSSGWEVVTGPTVGYLVGFVAAADLPLRHGRPHGRGEDDGRRCLHARGRALPHR